MGRNGVKEMSMLIKRQQEENFGDGTVWFIDYGGGYINIHMWWGWKEFLMGSMGFGHNYSTSFMCAVSDKIQ